ncbi:hypothetical protein ACXR2T_04505 [Leucobacter sp. HY1910]
MSAAVTQVPIIQRAQAGAVAPAARVAPVRIRLTRRGRVVFGGLAACAVAASFALVATLGAPQAVASGEPSGAEFGYIVAAPGASLWQLATELDPAMDPRELVAEIIQLNQLRGADIAAGQPIAVPLRYGDSGSVMAAEELGL